MFWKQLVKTQTIPLTKASAVGQYYLSIQNIIFFNFKSASLPGLRQQNVFLASLSTSPLVRCKSRFQATKPVGDLTTGQEILTSSETKASQNNLPERKHSAARENMITESQAALPPLLQTHNASSQQHFGTDEKQLRSAVPLCEEDVLCLRTTV